MDLEDALGLKAGSVVRATMSWCAPGQVTEGRDYTLYADAFPIYASDIPGEMVTTQKPASDSEICNALLPIIDDRNRNEDVVYCTFNIIRQG